MQVWNVLHAARCKCRTQKKSPKNRHLGTIAQLCRAISSQVRHVLNLLSKARTKPANPNHWCKITKTSLFTKLHNIVIRFISVMSGNTEKQSEKNLLSINISSTCPHNIPTSGWDRFVSLGHPCKFQRVSHLSSVTARHSSSGRQPNFAALNRGRHLYSAERPSRWALAHILFLNNSVENGPIWIIFGLRNPEEIWRHKCLWICSPHLKHVSTCPCEMRNSFSWLKLCCFLV